MTACTCTHPEELDVPACWTIVTDPAAIDEAWTVGDRCEGANARANAHASLSVVAQFTPRFYTEATARRYITRELAGHGVKFFAVAHVVPA